MKVLFALLVLWPSGAAARHKATGRLKGRRGRRPAEVPPSHVAGATADVPPLPQLPTDGSPATLVPTSWGSHPFAAVVAAAGRPAVLRHTELELWGAHQSWQTDEYLGRALRGHSVSGMFEQAGR